MRNTLDSRTVACNKGSFVAQVSNAESASDNRCHTSEGHVPSHDDAALVTAQISNSAPSMQVESTGSAEAARYWQKQAQKKARCEQGAGIAREHHVTAAIKPESVPLSDAACHVSQCKDPGRGRENNSLQVDEHIHSILSQIVLLVFHNMTTQETSATGAQTRTARVQSLMAEACIQMGTGGRRAVAMTN